ncbi:MAG: nucleotidyltransferase domain-containing protein [Methanofastidiosum sp.]
MNITQIKNKIDSPEYDFLRTNPHLGNNIILLTVGGSHAYGTDTESSDLDVRGIAVETKKEILGLSNFEQFVNEQADTVVYALKKIVSLMLACNPNTIELLGVREDYLFILTEEGKLLRDNINLFLSRKAAHSFGGYATAQLRRLQNALARDNYPQKEKERHIMNSILNTVEHLKQHYKYFTDKEIRLYLDKSDREGFEEEIFMDINLIHYPLRDFKNIYSEISNVVKDYNKLNYRNRKKTDLALNKHAMHLIRLLIMGREILEGKPVQTYREYDREFLLDIRDGKYSYDQIFEMVDEYEEKFKYAIANTVLPAKPDFKKIEELVISILESRLKNELI